MSKQSPGKRCPAMIRAGIENPVSQEGIAFCTDSCPYSCCIVFEHEKASIKRARGKINLSIALRAKGVTVEDIALLMEAPVSTIQRYIRSGRKQK